MSSTWRARLSVGAIFAAFLYLYHALGRYGVSTESVEKGLLAAGVAGIIELTRRDALLPWWSWSAHVFSAGFLFLAKGPENPTESLVGLGLCALGAPALWQIYRHRDDGFKRRKAQVEADLARLEADLKRDDAP